MTDIDNIIKCVVEETGYTLEQMKGKSQERDLCDARQLAMALCRERTFFSLKHIGLHFGRCHSTVYRATMAVRDRCDTDPFYRDQKNRVLQNIEQ